MPLTVKTGTKPGLRNACWEVWLPEKVPKFQPAWLKHLLRLKMKFESGNERSNKREKARERESERELKCSWL